MCSFNAAVSCVSLRKSVLVQSPRDPLPNRFQTFSAKQSSSYDFTSAQRFDSQGAVDMSINEGAPALQQEPSFSSHDMRPMSRPNAVQLYATKSRKLQQCSSQEAVDRYCCPVQNVTDSVNSVGSSAVSDNATALGETGAGMAAFMSDTEECNSD